MTVPSNNNIDTKYKEGKVHISKEAFRNMITHVLRFGNAALENSVEVMGICLGKLHPNGKDILLLNAIPISHGTQISNGFSQEELDTFKKIETPYLNQNLHTVGWYHSHPGWGLFFSDIAIKNHRIFQNEQRPYAFCIIFDHTLMGQEDSLGFEAYRLDNFVDPMNKEHHKVVVEIEIPNTLEYFKWIQKFVEDIHKKEPIMIKEYKELDGTAPSDLQEIPKSEMEINDLEINEVDQTIKPIISGFQEGSSRFSDIFAKIFEVQIANWSNDINQGTTRGTELLTKTVTQMKDKISVGINNIESWFNRNLDEIVDGFKGQFHHYIDTRIESQKELVRQTFEMKEDVIKNYNSSVDENLNSLTSEMSEKTKELTDKIKNTLLQSSKLEELIKNSSDNLLKISDETDIITKNIKKDIETNSSDFEQSILNEIKKLNNELNSVKAAYSKMNNTIKNFQKIAESLKEF
jgi:proteasome lid subunit RPN8/RPN11